MSENSCFRHSNIHEQAIQDGEDDDESINASSSAPAPAPQNRFVVALDGDTSQAGPNQMHLRSMGTRPHQDEDAAARHDPIRQAPHTAIQDAPELTGAPAENWFRRITRNQTLTAGTPPNDALLGGNVLLNESGLRWLQQKMPLFITNLDKANPGTLVGPLGRGIQLWNEQIEPSHETRTYATMTLTAEWTAVVEAGLTALSTNGALRGHSTEMMQLRRQLNEANHFTEQLRAQVADAQAQAQTAQHEAQVAEDLRRTYFQTFQDDVARMRINQARSKQRALRQAPPVDGRTVREALDNNPIPGNDTQSAYTVSTHSEIRLHVGTSAYSRVFTQDLCQTCNDGPARYTCRNERCDKRMCGLCCARLDDPETMLPNGTARTLYNESKSAGSVLRERIRERQDHGPFISDDDVTEGFILASNLEEAHRSAYGCKTCPYCKVPVPDPVPPERLRFKRLTDEETFTEAIAEEAKETEALAEEDDN